MKDYNDLSVDSRQTTGMDVTHFNIYDLNQMLKDAVDKENYEFAGLIRDEILKRTESIDADLYNF